MMKKYLMRNKEVVINMVCFLIFIICSLSWLLRGNTSLIFCNNDDWLLEQLASGEMTGRAESHLLYIGYPVSLLISIMYRFFPQVPWYGMFLFAVMYISISVSVYALCKQLKNVWHKLVFILLVLLIFYSFILNHLMQIQYTLVTAVVCGASLTFFYLSPQTRTVRDFLMSNKASLFLFFLSLSIRDKACIMFVPTFLLIAMCKVLKDRKMVKAVCAYVVALVMITSVVFLVDQLAYSSPEWKDFRAYDADRVNIMDFGGFPDYSQNETAYKELGISAESYTGLVERYLALLDENINTHFMNEIVKVKGQRSIDVGRILHDFIEYHIFSYNDRPLNLIVYVLYFFAVLLIVVSKKWNVFFDLLALFGGRTVIWCYLLYVDRVIPRVTQGIYLTELLLLLAIMVLNKLWDVEKNCWIKKAILTFACVCILFTSHKWGIPHAKNMLSYAKQQESYSTTYKEMCAYFYRQGDNFYLLDSYSFFFFTESIFEPVRKSNNNFVLLGSWMANSPWTDRIAELNGFDSFEKAAVTNENVYFVFMNTDWTNYTYLEKYIQSKYPDVFLQVHDTVQTNSGVEFLILKFVDEEVKG